MSTNRYKVTYECDCGQDYGSCGRRNAFLLSYHNGSDTAALYHRQHVDDPTSPYDGILELVAHFTDNKLAALGKILSCPLGEEHWTSEDNADAKTAQYSE